MFAHSYSKLSRTCYGESTPYALQKSSVLRWLQKQVMRAKVVAVMRSYAQDEVNQEDSEQNEVDGMKHKGKAMHIKFW